jgi:hypothetical protein
MVWGDTLRTTLILECESDSDGVRSVTLVPVFIKRDSQPEVLSGQAAARVLESVTELSARLSGAPTTEAPEANREHAQRSDFVHRAIRAKSHRFFLPHFRRYPARIVVQQLAKYARNRIHQRLAEA